MTTTADLLAALGAQIDRLTPELVTFRRDLHAHPELSWHESRTTARVTARLERAGITVTTMPQGGIVADLGAGEEFVVLRADLDALAVEDRTGDPWASTVPGAAHACGHDVHTTALLGAGLALAGREDLPGRVRLLFQPAEEVMPGGALATTGAGVLDGACRIFSVHCDPTIDVGHVGLREGPLTGAADFVTVELTGTGGHTSRPHLTEDLTFALGKLVTELPAVLTRRFDPRAGVSVVWGQVQAGSAANVIPAAGRASGTVRMLDAVAWADAEQLVTDTVTQVLAPYGVRCEVTYVRGVPPVVNDARAIAELTGAVTAVVGPDGAVGTQQSLGGEDFAWYLERVPGAMARLGTRTPGGPTYDLHQGDLRIDEGAVPIGAKVLAAAAITALVGPAEPGRNVSDR